MIDDEYCVRVADELLTLREGQMAFLPRGIPHTYANAGESTGRILVVSTPGGLDNLFRDVDGLCRVGTPSQESLMEVGAKHQLDFVGPPIFA